MRPVFPVLALAFMVFLVNVSASVMTPFLPVYAQSLGTAAGIDIGLFTSVFLLTRVIMNSASGTTSDRLGRRLPITLGIALCVASSLSFAISQDWYAILAIRALQGVGSAMVWAPATALVGDLIPQGKRGWAMGIYNSVATSGWVIGPALGGGLQWYARSSLSLPLLDSFRAVFFVSALSLLISLALALVFVREKKGLRNVSTPDQPTSIRPGTGIIADPVIRRTLIVMSFLVFSFGLILALVEPLLVYHTQRVYGLTADEVTSSMALIYSVSGAFIIAIQLASGKLADRFSKKKMIAASVLAAQLITLLMPFAVSLENIGVLIVTWYAIYAVASPAYFAFMQDLFPDKQRGALTGAFLTIYDFGSLAGPIIGFLIYDNVSATLPFIMSSSLGVATVLALLIYAKEPTKEKR